MQLKVHQEENKLGHFVIEEWNGSIAYKNIL